jgi:predicted GIY-YIG superfamily endonuclease
MRREHCYYVYMVQSASRRALYIGMTSKLIQRVFQHKTHVRRIHRQLQRRPPGVLGKFRRRAQSHHSREATQELA